MLELSEELDELTELLVDSETVVPLLHAVKVRSIVAAVTALKILLIFMPFFLSINKKVRSRSHAPKNAKLRLLRHNSFLQKNGTKRACTFTYSKSVHFLEGYSVVSQFNYSTLTIVCQGFRKKMSSAEQIFMEYHPRFPTIILVQSSCRRWFFVLQ